MCTIDFITALKYEYFLIGNFASCVLGWFWFLQEFAKVGKTWKTMDEVAQSKPKSFISRKPISCYRCAQSNGNPDAEKLYAQVDVKPGEVLVTGELYTETVFRNHVTCCFQWMLGNRFRHKKDEIKYLQCTDVKGFEVLLDVTHEGEFSPVGDTGCVLEDAVYLLEDIIRFVELPVYAKLSQGSPPSTPCSFTGLVRLEEVYFEETIIACTLGTKNPIMVEFPSDSEIQFMRAKNGLDLFGHAIIKRSLEHCDDSIDTYLNTIKVVQNFYPEHIIKNEVPSPVKGRSLPPLPAYSEDEVSMIADTEGTVDTTTDDFTEDEDETDEELEEDNVQANKHVNNVNIHDHNYEVIPAEKICGKEPPPIRKYPPIDDQGYLMPTPMYSQLDEDGPIVQMKQSVQNNNNTMKPIIPQRSEITEIRNKMFQRRHSADLLDYRSSTLPRSGKAGEDPAPMDADHLKDRLDAFLTDSLQELNRMQKGDIQDLALIQSRKHNRKISTPFETDDDVNEFLEKIFDCDNFSRSNSRRMSNRKGSMGDAEELMRKESLDLANSSFRGRPLRFSYSTPDATLRKHNLKSLNTLQPLPRTVDFYEEPPSSNTTDKSKVDFTFDNLAYGLEESARINDLLSGGFVPVQIADSNSPSLPPERSNLTLTSPHISCQTPSPDASEKELYDLITNRTDSGIFVSTRWSDYNFDSESPYATPSEDSWTPPDDISSLSVTEVARSLRYIGMKHHVVLRFVEEQIDGKQLQELDDVLVREGFPYLNALERKKVIDFANGWRPKKL